MRKLIYLFLALAVLVSCTPQSQGFQSEAEYQMTPGESLHVHSDSGLGITPQGSQDVVVQSNELPTETPTPTNTPTNTPTRTPTSTTTSTTTPSQTSVPNTNTPPPQGNIVPFPSAPLCPDHSSEHNVNKFHTLWDSTRGCHYDHEHGTSPFIPAVANAFPGFNLSALLCGNEISHCNPSSPTENVHKHGGHKWQVDTNSQNGGIGICQQGFEGGTIAVKGYAIQFHAHGREDIEHEVRNHSSVALLSFCKDGNPNDVGYMFVGQLQEYGERVMPYQGMVLPYPDNFLPIWDGRRGQYFTNECYGANFIHNDPNRGNIQITCRPNFSDPNNNLSKWSSKISGTNNLALRPPGSKLFTLLFNVRDGYQRMSSADLVHPFTWRWVCGGLTYNPVGCRHNNSASSITELKGVIPAAWDNLAGWDTDPRVGRITAQGFVTRGGDRNPACTVAVGLDCQPIKLVSAFVGTYSSEISAVKVSNPTAENTPERDIYFCNGVVCSETSPGAVPSGWIGAEN